MSQIGKRASNAFCIIASSGFGPEIERDGIVKRGLRHDSHPRWHNLARIAASFVIAALILLVDILSGAKGMAGVLYVPLLVAIATNARQRDVILFGSLGIAFAGIAFLIAYARTPERVSAWPLGIGIATVVITSALLTRLIASREALLDTNRNLAYNEWRYRAIFQQSRFPFWERDFSATLRLYKQLRDDGVTSLLDHYRKFPELYQLIGESIKILDFNDAMMNLIGASNREEFPRTIAEMQVNPVTMMMTQQAIFDGTRILDGRSTLTTISGQVKDIWVAGEISQDPERAGIMVGFLIDLTERERAERLLASARAELARASRVATVGALSVSIAHELNQPLAATVMNAQTCLRYLRRDPPDVGAAIAAAERTADEGARAGHVVRRTREMATKRARHAELVALGGAIEQVFELLDHDIRSSGVDIRFTHPAEDIEIEADRVALQQVFANLISNALQAMTQTPPGNRHLAVVLRVEADHVVIEVRDSGHGIAQENIARLFEPFFTTKDNGVGVGLAISRSAVEAMGGRLRAYNADSGGAVFECRMPLEHQEV